VSALVGTALVVVGILTLRDDDAAGSDEARTHAEAACELIAKAEEATRVETNARVAAAMFLLDNAIVESSRAAEAGEEFVELDRLVQAVHTAAHKGGVAAVREGLGEALASCRESTG